MFKHTDRAKYEAKKTGTLGNVSKPEETPAKEKVNLTKFWGSEYKKSIEATTQKQGTPAERPLWSYPRQAYSSKRSNFETENMAQFGTYGHNPRNKLPHEAEGMTNETHVLSIGTTKTSGHVPGYNGYIPKTDFNAHAQASGSMAEKQGRQTWLKQNIVENYCTKLPGYAGHHPASCVNDRGSLRPNCLNADGEQF